MSLPRSEAGSHHLSGTGAFDCGVHEADARAQHGERRVSWVVILTAVTMLVSGTLMSFFEGDYARLGRTTGLLFLLGMIAILFAPDTSKKRIAD